MVYQLFSEVLWVVSKNRSKIERSRYWKLELKSQKQSDDLWMAVCNTVGGKHSPGIDRSEKRTLG